MRTVKESPLSCLVGATVIDLRIRSSVPGMLLSLSRMRCPEQTSATQPILGTHVD